MKNNFKFHRITGCFLLILVLKTSVSVYGQQDPASASWPFDVNLLPVTVGNITASEPIPGNNIKNFTLISSYLVFELADTEQPGPDSYIQFKLTPYANYDFYLNGLSMQISSRFSTMKIRIEYSTSMDFSNPVLLEPEFSFTPVLSKKDYAISDYKVQNGSSLYVRIYFTHRSYPTDFIKIHDFQITGTTVSSDYIMTSITYAQAGYCPGEGTAVVSLTGTEGGTFSSTPGLVIDSSTGSINLATSQPGTYMIYYTFSEVESTSTSVTIHPLPDCTISGTKGPVLPSSTSEFTGPAGMTGYIWSVTGNGIITGPANAPTVTIAAGPDGGSSFTLSLTVEDGNECTGTSGTTIPVNEPDPGMLPTAILSGTQSVCVGGSADLTVNLTGQAPWSFTWFDGINEHSAESYVPQHVITVYPTENTTYSLTGQVKDGNGNSGAATGEAKVYLGPITKAPKIMACPNTTIEIPITVESFREVRDISLALQYDPAVLTYQSFENGDIGFGENALSNIGVNDNSYGSFRIITLSNTSEENLPHLSDGATLLTLKFIYKGGTTDLTWIDAPDDSWCSYSFLSSLDETGFESQAFCDVPTEAYYINGSVRLLDVINTDVNPIAAISTITGTPVIIPVSVSYPDLEAQNVNSSVLTDARISYGTGGTFPTGARIFKVTYNGVPVLSSPFNIGNTSEVMLSEILGNPAKPLLNHSGQTVTWEFFVDGITAPADLPVHVEALAYTNPTECITVMDTESFTLTFVDASLTATESVTVCEGEPLLLTAEIGYPVISNLNPAVKADAKLSAMNAFPEGTVINWSYNSRTNGSHTLSASTAEIMLSTIVGTLPNPLQGHSGTDIWSFDISNAGLMNGNIITVQAVALLEDEYYIHTQDQVILTVNPLPEITAASLLTSTNEGIWTPINGDFTTGYAMCADPAVDYHYLDVNELISSVELIHGFEMNAFYLDINNVPAGFDEYWNNKGVNASATDGWQAVMYDIISGELPMFYISYDGADYKLIDGLQYLFNNNPGNLRISGDYPAGSYTFYGSVTSTNGCVSEAITIVLDVSSAPVITCPGNITKVNDAGECGAAVTFEAIATGSPAPVIFYTLEDGRPVVPGDFFPVGITQVTATARNDCKTVTCSFNVTVVDNEPPAITCPVSGNVNVKLNNTNTYLHSGTGWNPTALDNCSVNQYAYSLSGATAGEGETLNGVSFNLGITTVTWTATDASTNTDECSFTVTVTGVLLSGTVKYYNKEETPLDNAIVSLRLPESGAEIATASTNAAGAYSFADVCPGLYNIILTTDKPMRSINSTDAGQVNAWNIAQSEGAWPSIEKVRFFAGDVNEDGYVESGDAAIIQNYFLILGAQNLFGKTWAFWKTQAPVSLQPQVDNLLQINIPEEGNDFTQHFYGQVCGDFNRSNIPAPDGMDRLTTKSSRIKEGSVSLQKGKTLLAEADNTTELPIRTESFMQVGAISLILDFPAHQFEVTDVYLNNDPERSAGFNVIDNLLVIGWNSVTPLIVEAGEPLVTLCLKIKNGESGVPYFFELVPNPLNELADENMEAIDRVSLIIDGLMIKEIMTGIETEERSGLTLTCWPNPFGENATIKYSLPTHGQINMEVTGMNGNSISILSNQMQPAGEYTRELHVKNLVPGMYHITLIFTDKTGNRKSITTKLLKH